MAYRGQKGRFITFEGGEGAGKSTQIKLLADFLEDDGIPCRITREPGGTPGAEAIRKLLLEERQPLDPLAEIMLFAAARADHVKNMIRPALDSGEWVLCDRFIDSTRAYQGAGRTVPPEVIDQLEKLAIGETRPDLTVILDLDPRTGLSRAKSRRGEQLDADRFEGEALAFHQRIREAFREIAKREPARCLVIDAAQPVDAIAAGISKHVAAVLRTAP